MKQLLASAIIIALSSTAAFSGHVGDNWKSVGAKLSDRTAVLEEVITTARAKPLEHRIHYINQTVNKSLRYKDDPTDVWQSPAESFTTMTADCEDYAIAKYELLRASGVSEQDLRVIIGRVPQRNIDHAVAAVRFDNAWIILDNRNNITPKLDLLRPYFIPIFTMTYEGGVRVEGTSAIVHPTNR